MMAEEKCPSSSLQSKLILMQISLGSFSVPTDMTLKLPDGSINVHRMIMAAVSPVFERMFYGDFKEGSSSEVELPSDSCKIMKLLIDFIYNGKCEVNSLDDILPLLEVIDRYQINKIPFQHMVGEAVLAELDSANYPTLLPKFASVMSEEANRKAAEKVMIYTNYDITADFLTARQIPEEVLLALLQVFTLTCHDLQIFDFLVEWHNYQTKTLGKSLQLTSQIFKCIRYSLIVPQMLSSKVAICDLADKQLLSQAYHYIYTSCHPLGEYNNDDPCKPPIVQLTREPKLDLKIHWIANSNISIKHDGPHKSIIIGDYCEENEENTYAIKSQPLSNGIFSFFVELDFHGISFAISDSSTPDVHLYADVLELSGLVTINVYDNCLFVKYIVSKMVRSTFGITADSDEETSYCVTIFHPGQRSVHFIVSSYIKSNN